MKRYLRLSAIVIIVAVAALSSAPAHAQSSPGEDERTWYSLNENGIANVDLFFFWSKTCPHCLEAHPYITALPEELPWLRLYSMEISEIPENAASYVSMAASVGQDAMYIPAFIYCGTMQAGYDQDATTGAVLRQALIDCQAEAQAELAAALPAVSQGSDQGAESVVASEADGSAPGAVPEGSGAEAAVARTATIPIPFIGEIGVQSMSLPALTFMIAGLDAFNPCAFFVLMFLLSLMVHAQSRSRMLLIGSVFVLFSGLIYFVFMSAWLNVFLWVGELKLITMAAGLVAIVIALINIKDFFWYKQGVSLSIPESAKPGLYARTRNLVHAGSLGAMLVSTILLAIAANSYELLCTAGFPMVYTRILTMEDLPSMVYYGYLAVYNVIYIIPLLAIVILFSVKFGSRKLGEQEGRALKLVSGLMMLMLGIVLVAAPEALSNAGTAIMLFVATLAIGLALIYWDRKRRERKPPKPTRRAGAR